MAINFPASPSTNDTHTENAITWIFNGTSWDAQDVPVTAASIGLGNVDNTADADKPVSTAQQEALDIKQNVLADAIAIPLTNNTFFDFDKSDTSGWALSNATFPNAGTADFATLTATNAPTSAGSVVKTITDPTDGDFIFYVKARADSVAGSGVNIQIGESPAQLIVSLGYNWATAAYEADRISFGVRDGGTLAGKTAGPSIEFDKAIVELAMQYDSRLGVVNYFVKEGGLWTLYGANDCDDPYSNKVRISTGGNDAADAYIYDVRVIRPSAVSIGDSITAGHNFYDPDPSFYGGIDPYTNCWQHYAGFGSTPDGLIANYGVGSEDSSEILARIPAMLTAVEPSVVFLQASANDYGAGFSQATRTTNIQSSIDLITAAGAKCVLLNAVYPNGANGDYYKTWWNDYSHSLTGVSEYIDQMEVMTASDGYNDASIFEADGVHPKASGYMVMGEFIQDRINLIESGEIPVKSNTHAKLKSLKTDAEYADDAAASVGGVPVGAIYRVTGGTVAWRQS